MNEFSRIDELLNGYIDGQLSEREQMEVKRLLAHDPEISARLDGLSRCSELVKSLPVEPVPETMLEDIKAKLERRTLLGDEPVKSEHSGAAGLFFRKLMSAAAVILLASGLGYVVYSVLGPAQVEGPLTVVNRQEEEVDLQIGGGADEGQIAGVIESGPAEVDLPEVAEQLDYFFQGSLEFAIADLNGGNEILSETLAASGFEMKPVWVEAAGGMRVYELDGNAGNLRSFLSRMTGQWNRFDSVRLSVACDQAGAADVLVRSAWQVAEIARQEDSVKQVATARDFNILNNMSELLPDGKQFVDGNIDVSELSIPKPVLTGGRERVGYFSDESRPVKLQIVVKTK